jgi:hypothetical protein
MFTVNAEDPKEVDPTEEWKWPTFSFLAKLENWVHQGSNILLNGRTTYLKPDIEEGQDEAVIMKAIEAKDPL